MEIILAFLVFFGGFTLGSIAVDKESGAMQSTRIDKNGSSTAKTHQTPQEIYLNEVSTCNLTRTLIYRDLTCSFHERVDQPVIENDDCEEESLDE